MLPDILECRMRDTVCHLKCIVGSEILISSLGIRMPSVALTQGNLDTVCFQFVMTKEQALQHLKMLSNVLEELADALRKLLKA
jgi:hypothetical protein